MSDSLVKYPIGIQSFSEIREGGYTYVDKTALIYRLIAKGKYYFLSRPRRFGKSLLLSTIRAYFEGRKELFEGLAIAGLEKDWEDYPVLTLSLSSYNPSDSDLHGVLDAQIGNMELIYGKRYDTQLVSARFANVIMSAYEKTGKKVVVLVDEYDAPLVAHLDDDPRRESVRSLLKSVYVNLKDMDQFIKFAMLTGVSRFSKMTIFSGLNNLEDISLAPEWSEICGITEEELFNNFRSGIEALARRNDTDYDGALGVLKENYDGYHFTEDSVDIYNPFSLLKALKNSKIGFYWFQSGTPSFLVKFLSKLNKPLEKIFTERVPEVALSEIETYRTSPAALLFQTGYLTIKAYDARRNSYRLGIPNKEVESGLFTELLSYNIGQDKVELMNRMWDIRDAFEEGDPDRGLDMVRSFFAGIPANVTRKDTELFFENNLFMLFRLIGIDARAEWWTSDGRIDMLLVLPDYMYVMELKLDRSAEEALAQIDTKEYVLPWTYDDREVFKIGINFNSSKRNIDCWKVERVH
ncbi:MAG: ATP-binding protein [Muribaculaceae bacterium]|nr:ATP-binding protein [Muribaculaceae bacterium]